MLQFSDSLHSGKQDIVEHVPLERLCHGDAICSPIAKSYIGSGQQHEFSTIVHWLSYTKGATKLLIQKLVDSVSVDSGSKLPAAKSGPILETMAHYLSLQKLLYEENGTNDKQDTNGFFLSMLFKPKSYVS